MSTLEQVHDLKIIRGTYAEYKNRIAELMHDHWAETGMPGGADLKVDMNDELYLQMEQAGCLLGMGIKEGDELIGYLSIFIYNHHQHKQTKFGQTDGFYVKKDKRGFRTFRAVVRMFEQAQAILKNEFNVEYLYLGTHASNDLKFLAESLDFIPASVMYVKRLD